MACLGSLILSKGKKFEESYKTPKAPSKLSNKQIKDYLATYGWVNKDQNFDFNIPHLIASPIDKPKKGLEFKSGYTGDVKYSGITDNMYRHFSRKEAEEYVSGDRASFENRQIKIDTYFNEVLYESWKRGIITLERKVGTIYMGKKKIKFDKPIETIFLNDLISLRMGASLKRDSVQNRRFIRQMKDLEIFEEASKRAIERDDRPICAAVG
ncbi:MAG: hypothetical protein PHH54_00350 [Candidatus Nanoarchaeia archaeon]|nr:hypothetical protein [Candidatus Nanoarchaeia archaeon]MDD5740413.1 hypothetical protein [Candidatus Nanoarchaeia archaeon]